jgi:phage N-6-adenine-methyltransferase
MTTEASKTAMTRSADTPNVHFQSKSMEWETPQGLFDELDAVFHFDLDAAAAPSNAKCQRFFTKEDDALQQRWHGSVFLNPPYGRSIACFMRKALEESRKGATVVCLVPARTDTAWWHQYARQGQIILLRGRLKFGNASHSAPFPSAIVIFWSGTLGEATRTLEDE